MYRNWGARMADIKQSKMVKVGWINFLLSSLVLLGRTTCHAGLVLDYQGIDWIANEADDIVITSKIPEPEPVKHYRADGTPVITGVPDITNGIKTKVTVYKVLKGQLSAGETVEVFMPLTGDPGSHPLEFPMDSAAGPFENQFTIMFIKRAGNQIPLETLRCFGSTILVNPVELFNFAPAPSLKDSVLKLIEKKPCMEDRDLFHFKDKTRFDSPITTATSGTAN